MSRVARAGGEGKGTPEGPHTPTPNQPNLHSTPRRTHILLMASNAICPLGGALRLILAISRCDRARASRSSFASRSSLRLFVFSCMCVRVCQGENMDRWVGLFPWWGHGWFSVRSLPNI